jgi:DNA (cytosine-5)-methyltransferase 1
MICGPMVGVEMYRHRYFETNWPLDRPAARRAHMPQVKMGRPQARRVHPGDRELLGRQQAREVMGMPWANRDGLREAIPPAYTEYIGGYLMRHLEARHAA